MKFTKIFLAIALLSTIVACNGNRGGEGGNTDSQWSSSGTIYGAWNLDSWSGDKENTPRIYIVFNEDGTFDLYQQMYSVLWFRYEGDYQVNSSVLTGVYADGTPWTNSYTVDYSQEPKLIRLTDMEDADDVAIYSSCKVPDSVIEGAKDPEAVRSVEIKPFL